MESLSDYMLLEVFDRLDPASLINCTEVCKRWNDLISKSASTMDKLTLEVDGVCKLRDLRNIHRRYSNLKLNEMTIRPEAWSLLMNCQQNLRTLELDGIKITVSNYKRMLQSIPTLQELTIVDCKLTSSARRDEIVKMPMLEKLKIEYSAEFLKNIDGSTLKKLYYFDNRDFCQFERSSFISLLKNLEDLSLTSDHDKVFNCFATATVQLKKLKISIERNCGSAGGIGAVSVVKAHTATLETLEIDSFYHPAVTDYDLTNVVPFNSLSTRSFEEFYKLLVDVTSPNYSPELIASTAKYYIPQLKSMKILRPRWT